MAIQDLAGNDLAAATPGQMLGYTEVSAEEILTLDMYRFLIKPIRDQDLLYGDLFVKRLLEGSQAVWETTQAKIFAVKDLWSITAIPDAFLTYLKHIVGWTNEPTYKRITDALDYDTLRRLIAASVPFWKKRGPEDTIIDLLQLVTGERVRIWNWFDFRWVLDETAMGEDHQGRDPWIIALPSEGDAEHRFNVRITDSGDLDRDLVTNLVKLCRPLGERVEVSYIDFLDRFLVVNEYAQWRLETGTAITVAGGTMTLGDDALAEMALIDGATAAAWAGYVAYARIRGGDAVTTGRGFGVVFYATDEDNCYRAYLDIAAATLTLDKLVAGAPTTIATYSFAAILTADQWYGLRVHVETGQIKVYIDGEERINATDSAHTVGTAGVFHQADTTIETDEVEVFLTPLDTDTVDINS